jgi:hypothetical protein
MLQRLDTTDEPDRPSGNEASRTVSSDPPERPRLNLSLPQILAGALAAASAAVAASWLGVAGTVVGAVVASVVVSVTSALYSRPLERGSQVIREVIPAAPNSRYRTSSRTGDSETMVLDRREPQRTAAPTTPRARRRVRWPAVALSSIVMLVVGFGVLTAVEALIGEPVSAIGGNGGGTTLSHIVDHSGSDSGGSDSKPANGGQTSDSTQAPTTGATDGPTTAAPTTEEPTEGQPTPTEATEPTQPGETAPTTAQPLLPADGGAAATP